jgi:hypothetical protein
VSALRLAGIVLLACTLGASGPAPDLAQYPKPRVVLAQGPSGPVLWWDATMWVDRLLTGGTPHDVALRALEYEAVKLFVTRAAELPGDTRHLHVNVVFTASGLASGPYGTNPNEGVRTLLTVDGDPRALRGIADWEPAAKRGTFPPGLAVKPSADLPRDAGTQ